MATKGAYHHRHQRTRTPNRSNTPPPTSGPKMMINNMWAHSTALGLVSMSDPVAFTLLAMLVAGGAAVLFRRYRD